MCLKFTYLGLFWDLRCYTGVHETKIHDIGELRKCLMQTWFDFEQDIIYQHCD